MRMIATELAGVVLLEPRIYEDPRGLTYESHNRRTLREVAGIDAEFVQENRSRSRRNVIRGVHYQLGRPQGKLVGVLSGEIFDVAVDLRRSSPAFGRWTGFRLTGEDRRVAWIPPGFGHAFLALTDNVEVIYKLTAYWAPDDERVIRWDDPDRAIRWPLTGEPLLSKRDAEGASLARAEVYG
jgi:dTDP-4-dehydrorhamnose 3,5-epimerase